MSATRRMVAGAVMFALISTVGVYGQTVVSAQAGLINYVEGQVTLDGAEVARKAGLYPQVKENTVLSTAEGRVELLLNPGTFLRMGENGSLRMISTRLIDTRLEVQNGAVLVECVEVPKDTNITLVYKGATVSLRKQGLYRLDAGPAVFSVLEGEAVISGEGQQITLKGGRRTSLAGVYVAEKFNAKDGDALYRWSRRRSEYLAMANISIARSFMNLGRYNYSSGLYGVTGWYWNPWMGMYTYLPRTGSYLSPFGWYYYSPRTVYMVYNPQPSYGGSDWRSGWSASQLGYSTVPRTAVGTSGVLANAPAGRQASAPAASAPPVSSVSRDSGRAGGAGR